MWNAIKKFFKYSETIFLARLQVLIGTVLEILVVMDPALFAPLLGEYFPLFMILHGFTLEYLRRRRADDLGP